jgi:hypothetical protein
MFKNYYADTEKQNPRLPEQPHFCCCGHTARTYKHVRNLRCFCFPLFVVSLLQNLLNIHTPSSQCNNFELY